MHTRAHLNAPTHMRTPAEAAQAAPAAASLQAAQTIDAFHPAQPLREHLDVGVLLLQVLADACDGAPSADATDEHVNLALGLLPDLGASRGVVDLQRGRGQGTA